MYPRHLLPGIAVEAQVPPSPDALPRMDVALFVGFAARGPCHRPVRIDSVAAYAQVFGGDLVLSRDLRRGADTMAALAPAVRAFFANGGSRCWVIRTCRTEALERRWRGGAYQGDHVASARLFELPGVFALRSNGSLDAEPVRVRAASLGSWADTIRVSARLDRTAFQLSSVVATLESLTFGSLRGLAVGDLILVHGQSGSGYAAVTTVDQVSTEARWLVTNDGPPPPGTAGTVRCERLRLVWRSDDGGGELRTSEPIGLTPAAPDSWWTVVDDDDFYAAAEVAPRISAILAPSGDPAVAWLPIGLGDAWSQSVGPIADDRTPLQRDGLSRFDAELFLDPALAHLRTSTLAAEAQRMRDIDGLSILGLHGAFCVPGGADFGEPSLIVVADAVQPGWDPRVAEALPPPQDKPVGQPATWRDHKGSCAVPPANPEAQGPDAAAFLDCGTRLLTKPVFEAVQTPRRTGVLDLRWSPSEPGVAYVLEEAGRADFKDAEEIWRGTDLTRRVAIAREGAYYYRVHAVMGDNISAASVIGLRAYDSAWATREAGAFDARPLIDIQTALLRTCAAMGDQFAPLALPRHYEPAAAIAHVSALRAAVADNEARALSFGALYHPWLVGPRETGAPRRAASRPEPIDTPPLGAVAGAFARQARRRGAWIAPANMPLEGVVATAPTVLDGDRETLAAVGIDLIRHAPTGFVISDALTLSQEPDWGEVNVRRLMSLLRRVCVRRGAAFVFEPNGDVVRRAIERSFGHMLDDLTRRGAFAGKGGADSYRLSVDPTEADRMNGRLVVEIAVAPSEPLRFLTLVLKQAGERFTIAEER